MALLTGLLPILLLVGFWIFLMNQMQGGGSKVMSFGKSRAKRMSPDSPKVTYKDVAGADEAVEELQEIKEFLENPKKFQALGARIPKGVLLYGPPGTGKTLLARATAGEAGVPFFSISGSDFVEMFVGVGASRVRDLFEQAKQASPCIIFIDEIDAVGRHRGAGMGGGHDEREQTLNQLLVEMDGFEQKDNVILIAATNRPDILDPALLRPGRFDRQIVVDRPDRKGRRDILEVHSKGKPLGKELDLDVLAAQTPGFTGADLANVINESALLAARRGEKTIGQNELEEGIMRVIAGPEKKSRLFSEKERKITAYHEMGHALVGYYLEGTDDVHKISIVSRGQALGYTISLPSEDRYLTTKGTLMAEMAMTLGGRAAEELVFHEVTTGAANDLEKVTHTAKQMIMRFGMSEKLGPRVLGRDHDMPFLGRDMGSAPDYSEEIAREIDDEIRRVIEEAHDTATRVLREHMDELHHLSLDPDRARDGRQGSVRAAARRRGRRRDGLPGGGRSRRPARPGRGTREEAGPPAVAAHDPGSGDAAAARGRSRLSPAQAGDRGACCAACVARRENEQPDHSRGRRNADCLDRDPARAEQIDEREHRAADAERDERHHGDERDASRRGAGLLGDRGTHLDRQVPQLPDREQRGADDRRAAVEQRVRRSREWPRTRPRAAPARRRSNRLARPRASQRDTRSRPPPSAGDGRCRVGRGDRVEPGREAGSEARPTPHRGLAPCESRATSKCSHPLEPDVERDVVAPARDRDAERSKRARSAARRRSQSR